jgi:succinate-semialdehyde dehydrogenase / glutarate-semialdehyde dehydrogenase
LHFADPKEVRAMAIASVNPATGERLQTFTALTDAEIEQKLNHAAQAFIHYRHTDFGQRATWLQNTATLLEQNRQAYGQLITQEMGKPIQEAIAEVEKSALVCRYYAEHAARYLADVPVATAAQRSFIRYQPLGIILAVMPWNFPFWQVFRFAAPALMAGNVALLKHASNVPQSALAIAEIFNQAGAEAGLPTGIFQTLLIGADQVSAIVTDPRIQAATLTGSEAAGASLAAQAGQAIKKTVLELGGSDPFIILDSADLDLAVATAVKARLINNGQSCVAAKRFIVAESILDAFKQRFIAGFQQLKVGDPSLSSTDVGPLATPSILHELDQQVQTALAHGAELWWGGQVLQGNPNLPIEIQSGNFYAPTILHNLAPSNPIYRQELFGPVAMVLPVPDCSTAIQVANDTPFGLAASAWTQNPSEQERLIEEIAAGAVFINGMVKSDPRLPFGGIKQSGYGRELGQAGIHEFVNLKTIVINP